MTEIDWSKAPKGATHWEPKARGVTASWMKLENGKWSWWGHFDGWAGCQSPLSQARIDAMVPRTSEPPAWDGTGLPPSGIAIDYRHRSNEKWLSGVVKYASLAHLIMVEDGSDVELHYHTSNMHLRPSRTPEQIAADEREKAVLKMVNLIGNSSEGSSFAGACRALYDAGYRPTQK